jgi:transposase
MNTCIGIDVAKDSLAVCTWPGQQHLTFANTPEGHAQLIQSLRGQRVDHLLLEATGGYERRVRTALLRAGHPVTRINPQRARAFALAMGTIAKTDRIDAAQLARMAQVLVPSPAARCEPEREALRELVKRREQLVGQRDDERRRLKQAELSVVREDMIDNIAQLQRRIGVLDRRIVEQSRILDDALGQRLQAVPGIGPVTRASLMAYLPELGTLDRRQVAALAGLAPYNVDSGRWSGKRAIRGGRAALRRVLYMACLSVIRTQADFKCRYQALRQRGKCAKVAITACMRVLLVRLNAMVRDNTEWRMQMP